MGKAASTTAIGQESMNTWIQKIALTATKQLKTREQTGYLNTCKFFTTLSLNASERINEIPSETTSMEREFLFNFFANTWSGEGDVIEIGPFLGGTTRSIAMGMNQNPRISTYSKLHTYDRFEDYSSFNMDEELISRLILSGCISARDIDAFTINKKSFSTLFDIIHGDTEYSKLIIKHCRSLPDLKEQAHVLEKTGSAITLEDINTCQAVFVDGCKSWYSTKYFMQLTTKKCKPGTYFIFQDFGWYTCYWLSSFIGTFPEKFRPITRVDNTHVYMLIKNFDSSEIERFPDNPETFGAKDFDILYANMIDNYEYFNDYYTITRLNLHHAGALATLGEKGRAIEIINRLKSDRRNRKHLSVIKAARKRPTYTPFGPVLL